MHYLFTHPTGLIFVNTKQMKKTNYKYKTMKIIKPLLILLMLTSIFACSKKDSFTEKPSELNGMTDLVVNQNFDWSAGISGELSINFINPNNVSVDQEIVNLVDQNGIVVKRTRIQDSTAQFFVDLPQNASYFVQFPVTGDEMEINSVGMVEMTLGQTIFKSSSLKSSSVVESCTSCDNPIINPGAEEPSFPSGFRIIPETQIPGWETTASDGKIEIWVNGFQGVPAQEGSQYLELNANMVADLFQELCLEPGSNIVWSVWHRGRAGVDVAEVKIGATVESAVTQATMTDGKTAWGYYSGTYAVPEGQTTTYFVFSSVSSAGSSSVGNFLDNFEIKCDYDGDGIPDDEDDDPGNGEVAFTSYFPTSGKQIVAFEDLWPSTGDFDFNDLTMSNQVKINKDIDFNLINAEFTISIDAIGASIHNGIGMMFYKESGATFGSNIIESVSGDVTLDPDNTNGLILADDVFEAISEYYQNNGVGPTKIPDTLKFNIVFNSNADDFIPELYIFRSSDRSYEIHRSNFPPTAAMDLTLLNTVNDNGNFKTENGLPWGLEIILDGQYKSPRERVDMLAAYPQFQLWATSNGAQNTTWYQSPDAANVFDIFE
jgi:LruC domain-containing protein